MDHGSSQEKTEAASPKRRKKAREQGQIAKSKEIASAAVLLGALGVGLLSCSWMLTRLSHEMALTFRGIARRDMTPTMVHTLMGDLFFKTVEILFPFLLPICLLGILSYLVQTGFLFVPSILPKFSRVNPFKGLKNLLSMKSIVELLKSLLKVAIVAWIAYLVLEDELVGIPSLFYMSLQDVLSFMGHSITRLILYAGIAMIVIALADYGYQRWQIEKDLRMTKQEVKEESKNTEGDPTIKARIRRKQMELARMRMMAAVPTADVVITNPTHLAVALQYDPETMLSPKIIAKGAGFVAQRIRDLAREHRIPIVENKPLAQALYKAVRLGDNVPAELYKAVAEVLAYVYRLKGRTRRP